MLHVIRGFDERRADVLERAFRFRHAAFVEEAGWENLRREDGRETDQFDTPNTLHIVLQRHDEVVAYSRLNPTTEPYVLSEVYPHLAAGGIPRDPGTWEWSRMGTARHARGHSRGWGGPIGGLFRAIAVVSLHLGIETLIWQAHPAWIARAADLGFDPAPLGPSQRVAGERIVAARMAVAEDVLSRMDAAEVPRLPAVTWASEEHGGCAPARARSQDRREPATHIIS